MGFTSENMELSIDLFVKIVHLWVTLEVGSAAGVSPLLVRGSSVEGKADHGLCSISPWLRSRSTSAQPSFPTPLSGDSGTCLRPLGVLRSGALGKKMLEAMKGHVPDGWGLPPESAGDGHRTPTRM